MIVSSRVIQKKEGTVFLGPNPARSVPNRLFPPDEMLQISSHRRSIAGIAGFAISPICPLLKVDLPLFIPLPSTRSALSRFPKPPATATIARRSSPRPPPPLPPTRAPHTSPTPPSKRPDSPRSCAFPERLRRRQGSLEPSPPSPSDITAAVELAPLETAVPEPRRGHLHARHRRPRRTEPSLKPETHGRSRHRCRRPRRSSPPPR